MCVCVHSYVTYSAPCYVYLYEYKKLLSRKLKAFLGSLDHDTGHHQQVYNNNSCIHLNSALLTSMFEIQAPKTLSAKRIFCIWCRQLFCSFSPGWIICSEFEMLLTLNFHLEGFCQATGHDVSLCSATSRVNACVCVVPSLCAHIFIGAYVRRNVSVYNLYVNKCVHHQGHIIAVSVYWLLLAEKVTEPLRARSKHHCEAQKSGVCLRDKVTQETVLS